MNSPGSKVYDVGADGAEKILAGSVRNGIEGGLRTRSGMKEWRSSDEMLELSLRFG